MPIRYTKQFKEDVLAFYAANPEISISQICRDFGISYSAFSDWKKGNLGTCIKDERSGASEHHSAPAGCQSPTVSAEELRRVQKRNRELEMEVTILKRAAAYFAKDTLPKGNTLSF